MRAAALRKFARRRPSPESSGCLARARPCGRGAGAMVSAAPGRRREGGVRVSADLPLSPVPPVSPK